MAHTAIKQSFALTHFAIEIDLFGQTTLVAKNNPAIKPIQVPTAQDAELNRRVFHKKELVYILGDLIQITDISRVPYTRDGKSEHRLKYWSGWKKAHEVLYKLTEQREYDALGYILASKVYFIDKARVEAKNKAIISAFAAIQKYYDLYLKEYEVINDPFLAR